MPEGVSFGLAFPYKRYDRGHDSQNLGLGIASGSVNLSFYFEVKNSFFLLFYQLSISTLK